MNKNTDCKKTYVYQSIYFLIGILQCQKIFNDNNFEKKNILTVYPINDDIHLNPESSSYP